MEMGGIEVEEKGVGGIEESKLEELCFLDTLTLLHSSPIMSPLTTQQTMFQLYPSYLLQKTILTSLFRKTTILAHKY